MSDAWTVYVADSSELIHLPPDPETDRTACGLETALMSRVERSPDMAGVWCTGCLNALIGREVT